MSDLLPATDGLFLGKDGDVVLAGNSPPLNAPLTLPSSLVRFADLDADGIWSKGDPAIYDVNDDYVYTIGVDMVLVGTEPPDGTALLDPPIDVKFYDSNGNGIWDIGEPAVRDGDGDGFYNPIRRWNLLLKKLDLIEYPTLFIDGRLWYSNLDKHAYIDDPNVGSKQIALTGESQPPNMHGNTAHSPAFLYYFGVKGNYFTSADLTIGSASAVTIGSFTGLNGRYEIPLMGSFNFRPAAGNTADVILDVWWEAPLGTQCSAKFPITVKLGEVKHPFSMCVPLRNIVDMTFWSQASTGQTYYLRGQTRSEQAIISDRYITALEVA